MSSANILILGIMAFMLLFGRMVGLDKVLVGKK